ncbi:major facilitator superfamily domain-containing protein [Penicillium waksmanii]|uniref:major facilitator superfamily domain-containing protein n=1 Tax=Penicillium waksmanii TaxID=69791 RepID=UPI0025481E66|nr:major facilitator superfamily domain-containing protein [Penicillium waksmanii]KAJ5963113.1 major facilitator superfamily domain-containing protein [Penicillium waksmanii]
MNAADLEGQGKEIASHEVENVDAIGAISFTDEEEKALVKKIDLTLLPTIWVMYLLSYLDRTNIGNAKISGMEVDLNLTSNQYSIALVVFFVGYVVFEVPSNLALSRSRPSIYLPSIMILWGALTCVMAVVKDFGQLVALRTILGCIEAGFAPGVILLLSSWYKQTEQSKRFGVFISAAVLSGAFGGLIAAGIVDGLEGAHGIRGWRWLFIIEGVITIGFAIFSIFILPDFPMTTRRLSDRERQIAVTRLASQNVTATTADTEHLSNLNACKVACQDPRTWAFIIGYMVIVGSSTLTYFYPTLVKGLFGNVSTKEINLLTVPIYGVAFIATGITSYYGDKISTWRGLIIACWLGFSLICSILVCIIHDFTARYALLVLMAAGLWSTNGGNLGLCIFCIC